MLKIRCRTLERVGGEAEIADRSTRPAHIDRLLGDNGLDQTQRLDLLRAERGCGHQAHQ
jgi:hypothetical protein